MNRLKQLWNFIRKEDKKLITLFTTLVNIKCFTYYILPNVLSKSNTANVTTFTNSHFIATVIIAIFDLLLCWGFIHSSVKANSFNERHCDDETQSALQTTRALLELYHGNIIDFGIYGYDYITKIEQESVKGDEIWCISGDIEEDAKNSELGNIITSNLKKGVFYKYFITRVGDSITNKASWGEEKLREANIAYKKRLMFIKTNEELFAPDIDIIIYKVNQINKRIGFVCVEIGDDKNTYVYQQIDRITLQGICDSLSKYATPKNQSNFFQTISRYLYKIIHFCIEHLSIAYFLCSAGGLALLSFNKVVSLTSAALFLLPAIIEFFITVALIIRINDSISTYKDALAISLKNEKTLATFMNKKEIQEIALRLEDNALDTLMKQKGMGCTDKIFEIDENCSSVWLLSDLSHDIANQSFYNWLTKKLKEYKSLVCYVLYPKSGAAIGRSSRLNELKHIFSNRIKIFSIENISSHYIWSMTHGIILMENTNMQHNVYIALGTSNNTFYKKVITTEEEASALLGRLANIAGIEL